jgi:large subunit ribosomal protein L20
MRIKTGFARRRAHRKLQSLNKGYRMTKRRLVKVAKEARLHADAYAYNGRKERKQEFRKLWIGRINGAVGEMGLKYNTFMHNLKLKNVILDRKILSEILLEDPQTFKKIVEETK